MSVNRTIGPDRRKNIFASSERLLLTVLDRSSILLT